MGCNVWKWKRKPIYSVFSAHPVFWHTQNRLPELITMRREISVSSYRVCFVLYLWTNQWSKWRDINLAMLPNINTCDWCDKLPTWSWKRERENKTGQKCQACTSGLQFGATGRKGRPAEPAEQNKQDWGKHTTVSTWGKAIRKRDANHAWSAAGIIRKTNLRAHFAFCWAGKFYNQSTWKRVQAPLRCHPCFCSLSDSCCLSRNHLLNEPLNSSLIPHVKAACPRCPAQWPRVTSFSTLPSITQPNDTRQIAFNKLT